MRHEECIGEYLALGKLILRLDLIYLLVLSLKPETFRTFETSYGFEETRFQARSKDYYSDTL